MRLYHFTAAHLAKRIECEGITLGGYMNLINGQLEIVRGYIWLTANPSFEQSWCENKITIPYDRNAVRFTVEIPASYEANVIDWVMFCAQGNVDPRVERMLNGFDDPWNWKLYRGVIPVEWLTAIDEKPHVKVYSSLEGLR
jgi:hypothetical protein